MHGGMIHARYLHDLLTSNTTDWANTDVLGRILHQERKLHQLNDFLWGSLTCVAFSGSFEEDSWGPDDNMVHTTIPCN